MRIAAAAIFFAVVAFGQTVAFEVAVVKPSHDAPGSSGIVTRPGRMNARNVTLKGCIHSAYDIPESLIFGGPKWIDQDRFYIEAKAAGPAGDAEMMVMLQSLLADRFQLTLHRETRTIPGYELVAAKGGPKLKASAPGTPSRTNATDGGLVATSATLAHLAMKLSGILHAPVADATGIGGGFDFNLQWTTTDEMSAKAGSDSGPSIFTALQEQLGLKLQGRKTSGEVLVIDRAEKPSEN